MSLLDHRNEAKDRQPIRSIWLGWWLAALSFTLIGWFAVRLAPSPLALHADAPTEGVGTEGADTRGAEAKAFDDPLNFSVSGFSMAPTLMGRSVAYRCDVCVFEGHFPPPPARSADVGRPVCPCCGSTLVNTGKIRPADRMVAIDGALGRGDLVACKRPGDQTEYVKRVVGIPGDTIGLAGRRLTVNDQLIEQQLWHHSASQTTPTAPVHFEPLAGTDRWQHRDGWWIYGHTNPYQGGRPLPVSDDYPVNVGISRRLEPSFGLIVEGHCQEAQENLVEILFWTPSKIIRSQPTFPSQDHFVANSIDPSQPADGPVDATHPIAIRFHQAAIHPDRIRVDRLISYRLRSHDDSQRYPITLSGNQYFVLGDNVPIAKDSRSWGPVSGRDIIARLVRTEVGTQVDTLSSDVFTEPN